jgi:hypothetical protein
MYSRRHTVYVLAVAIPLVSQALSALSSVVEESEEGAAGQE